MCTPIKLPSNCSFGQLIIYVNAGPLGLQFEAVHICLYAGIINPKEFVAARNKTYEVWLPFRPFLRHKPVYRVILHTVLIQACNDLKHALPQFA